MSTGSIFEGQLVGSGMTFGIVLSRFNAFFGEKLLEGALDALKRSGVDLKNVDIARVPGAYEIPLTLQTLAKTKRYDALIALGVVVRGHTPHFDFVAGEAQKGIAQVMLQTAVPIASGLLTTDTLEQAIERSGTKAGNKGFDAALCAIEMVSVLKQISEKRS